MSSPGLTQILDSLRDEGLLDTSAYAKCLGAAPQSTQETPWFVHVLLGVGAWFAMAMLIIGLLGVDLIDTPVSCGVTGAVLLAGAIWLRHTTQSPYAVQQALALVMAGATLVVVAIGWNADGTAGGIALTVVGSALVFAYPDRIHRVISIMYACAGVLLIAYDQHSALLINVSTIGVAGACTWVWLRKARSNADWTHLERRPLGYGLALGVLILTCPAALDVFEATSSLAGQPWLGTIGLGVVMVIMTHTISQELGFSLTHPPVVALLVTAAAVLAITSAMPGVAASAILLVLGQHRRDRVLTALGILSGLAFISTFYYEMSITLLNKSFVLMASGVVLVIAAEVLRRLSAKAQAHA